MCDYLSHCRLTDTRNDTYSQVHYIDYVYWPYQYSFSQIRFMSIKSKTNIEGYFLFWSRDHRSRARFSSSGVRLLGFRPGSLILDDLWNLGWHAAYRGAKGVITYLYTHTHTHVYIERESE